MGVTSTDIMKIQNQTDVVLTNKLLRSTESTEISAHLNVLVTNAQLTSQMELLLNHYVLYKLHPEINSALSSVNLLPMENAVLLLAKLSKVLVSVLMMTDHDIK